MGAKIVSLHELTSKFIGKPYELGKTDCFSIIRQYLLDRNVDLVDEFNGITINDYPEIYKKNRKQAIKLMVEYFSVILKKIDKNLIKAGDVGLFSYHGIDFMGISIGQGLFISAHPKYGVTAISRDFYKLKEAWTWQR